MLQILSVSFLHTHDCISVLNSWTFGMANTRLTLDISLISIWHSLCAIVWPMDVPKDLVQGVNLVLATIMVLIMKLILSSTNLVFNHIYQFSRFFTEIGEISSYWLHCRSE